MLHTTRRNIAYPNTDDTDREDITLHLSTLAAALDVDVVYNHGTDAARVASAHQASGGRFWWATDTGVMWYDDGATWQSVGSIADGTITGAKIANLAITAAKIDNSLKPTGSAVDATEALRALGVAAGTAAAGNDPRLSDQRTPTDGSVTTAKLANLAVTSGKIADAAITNAKISAVGGITGDKIATGAIGAAQIADGSVSVAKLSFDPATQAEMDARPLIQYGLRARGSDVTNSPVVFPVAFSGTPVVFANVRDEADDGCAATSITASGFTISRVNGDSSTVYQWMAVGPR